MHMSDGIVNAPISLLFGVIAVAALGICAWKAREELDERAVPLAGLVAAFIFAVQMVNFPILPGVSGHLLGGALAAILVGPFTGALCVAIVLIVQALLFAGGGVSALGTNVTNMSVIGVAAGYATAVLLYRLARRWRQDVPVAAVGAISFIAAVIGTVSAAMGFVLEYSIGGASSTSLGTVATSMRRTHVLRGRGEAIPTALTDMAAVSARRDLVYLVRTHPARTLVTA